MDIPVEAYIPLYDVRRGPRVTTTVDDRDWVSYAPEAIDLDSIDPTKRFTPSSASVTSILHAWPNPDLPWGSHIPTSLIDGEDMLAWLLPAVPRSAVAQAGERFVVHPLWKDQANAVAPRIAAACASFVHALPSVFERRVLSGTVTCHPTSYDEHVLEGIDFDSARDAHAYLSSLGDEIVSNLGFLGWFTDCVTGWEVLVPAEVADFVKQLRLKERRKRGYIVNPVLDWPSVDLPWLYKNEVPFHYMWTEEAARDQRFIQLNPEYVKNYRRLSRDLGRPPLWDEVMKDHDEWGYICFTDEYLQENQSPPPVNEAAKALDEREYFVRPHEFWFPHKLGNLSVARRVLFRCNGSFPEFCDRADQLPVWIQGWTGNTIHRDASLKDRLDFYGLPPELRRCEDVNCRELKKIASAPTPMEMLMDGEQARLGARLPNLQAVEPSGSDLHSRFNTHSSRAQEKLASGFEESPAPSSSRSRLPLQNRLSSPAPSPNPPPPPPLTKRIGPRIADHAADEMDWEAEDGSTASTSTPPRPSHSAAPRGAASSAAPQAESSRQGRDRRGRGFVVAVGASARRRSASPARRGPSTSSSSSVPAAPIPVPRDEGVTRLPDPSARSVTVSRFDTREWRKGLQRLELELAAIGGKTSPVPSVASIRRQIQDIRWSPVVIQHAYVHTTWKQDELRFWSWGADKRIHRDHADLLNHALAVGRPLTIALPESMLPEVAPPEVEESEEHGHRIQGLVLTHDGRKVLAERYKAGLKMLAAKPHAGSFIFLGGAANFVVRRFMWHWVKDRIGEGVCRETTIRHKGRTAQPQDGTGITVYHDFAEVEEHDFIIGKVLFPRDGERPEGVRYYFPPYDVVFDSARDWYGEWTDWDEDMCLSIAEGIDNGTAEPKPYGEWQKILHRDRVRSVQSHQRYHLFRNKLRASDAR